MTHETHKLTTGELIGKTIIVENASNKTLIKIVGTIIDETKHFLVIETYEGIKHIPKKGSQFRIDGTTINGNDIIEHPVERTKMR